MEGFGIVFAEAALSGLPVIAGRSVVSPEAVSQGETGMVVDGDSAQQVAAALAALLRMSPERRHEMGARGRDWRCPGTRPPWSASAIAELLRRAAGR